MGHNGDETRAITLEVCISGAEIDPSSGGLKGWQPRYLNHSAAPKANDDTTILANLRTQHGLLRRHNAHGP
jgi:hypothetical protein